MSRNFEMLQQAERSRNLFRSTVALPPASSPPIAPELTPAEPQGAEEQIQGAQEKQTPAANKHRPALVIPPRSVPGPRWLATLRKPLQWLRPRSMGQSHNSPAGMDLKNLALHEEIKLVERVFFGPDSESNKVIVFSAVDNAQGGAGVCARAARTLAAQVSGVVCVVDADLHSRSLEHPFHTANAHGLSEALLQTAPIRRYAQQVASSNLWMIGAGMAGANLQLPLCSDRLRLRFEELRADFDHILINAPSLGTTANLTLLGQLADGVIFVVEANSTRRETTKQFKESLEEARVRVLGVVLNNRTFPIPESVYRKL